MSGKREKEKRIVALQYRIFPIEKDSPEIYPLKSAETAWQELQSGQGYVAYAGEGSQSDAIIRNVYLAYYGSKKYQQYLQPIYVFTGDRNFEAYVQAIDPEWVE